MEIPPGLGLLERKRMKKGYKKTRLKTNLIQTNPNQSPSYKEKIFSL